MNWKLREAVVPLYVLLCIGFGGSGQGVWGNMVLQLLGIAIIGWSLLATQSLRLSRAARGLFAIVGATLLVMAVQLLPLPPELWAALPGRAFIVDGFTLLGQQPPWLPISLLPYESMAAAVMLLPALAVLVGMLVAGAYRASWLVLAILTGAIAAVLLGALQVGSADPTQSPWYLYRRTNHGFATGFFSNSNHMASLLVVAVAFLLGLVAEMRSGAKDAKSRSAALLLALAGVLVLAVGILLNGSLAILLLVLPVLLIGGTMLLPSSKRLRPPVVALGLALISIAALAAVLLSPLQDKLTASNAASFNDRRAMWTTTLTAIEDHWTLGSGAGTFRDLYPSYEDQAATTRTVVNHAHNDYLEVLLETGVAGLSLLIGFFLWWGRRTAKIWSSASADRYAQAASIASAALLIHSVVDYPLRTGALSAIMAASLALMARPRLRNREQPADLWPTRHLSV